MTKNLNIRDFFRRSPPAWLRRYFQKKGVLETIDWLSIRPRNINPLVEAWNAVDEDLRGQMAEDFHAINLLATSSGKVQIIDEAVFHGKQHEVSAKLAELRDFYECAFWTFFEQPDCWKGAVFFAEADGKPQRQWRKRVNMPKLGRSSNVADGKALGAAIVTLFRQREGRGDHCVVEQYRRGTRGEKEYYFAYPQDHKQTAIEYHNGEFARRPHRPAFEIIFILDDEQQTLSIWHQGEKQRIADLQVAFAKAVLGHDISRESPKDNSVYDLDMFLDNDFVLQPRPELGIASAEVRDIRIRVLGHEQHSITIVLGTGTPGAVLPPRLTTVTHGIPRSMLKVNRIGIRVTFDPAHDGEKPKPRKFEMGWPNSCNLGDTSRDQVIQRMLVDHGIEPKRPSKTDGSHGG